MKKIDNIYFKTLRRLGIGLIAVGVLDLVLGMLMLLAARRMSTRFYGENRTLAMACMAAKDVLAIVAGVLDLRTCRNPKRLQLMTRVNQALLVATLPLVVLAVEGNIDNLIDLTLVLMVMNVYTLVQCGHRERMWERVRGVAPISLDLKFDQGQLWFNPLVLGPHLALSGNISMAVDRFLNTRKHIAPLEIAVIGLGEVSEATRQTMRDIFVEHYEDEERRVDHQLEILYKRTILLLAVSLIALSVWVHIPTAKETTMIAMILSNFAGFSLWQIGGYHFNRSEGYAELLRVMIAKQAKIVFL